MNCAVYKSTLKNKEGFYLFVENKDDYTRVPSTLMSLMGELEFVLTTELMPSKPLAQVDIVDVMQQLQEKGYYLQMPADNPLIDDLFAGEA